MKKIRRMRIKKRVKLAENMYILAKDLTYVQREGLARATRSCRARTYYCIHLEPELRWWRL